MLNISLSVPHFKQEFDYSCVAACVRMVLAFHGRSFSEADLRQLLDTRPSGTVVRNVLRLASLGFDVQLDSSNLALLAAALMAGTPPIVFFETGPLDYWLRDCAHVAVVVGLEVDAVSLNDPYFDPAPQRTSLTSFLQAWAATEHLATVLVPRRAEGGTGA
jgi:ABC-type bacteriocin/lantibiotic exporter with double-glycine peptidase domain